MSDRVHLGCRPRTRVLIALALVSPLVIAIAGRGWSDPATPTSAPDPDPGPRRLPDPVLGFAINAHHIGNLPLYLEGVDKIAEMGANTLIVVTPWFQEHVHSQTIRHDPALCPTAEQLEAILERAEQRGLASILMPIILIEHPGEKDWRGVIRPRSWEAWWRSYDRFTDYFLGIANRAGVDCFVVGSELNTTEDQLERWDRLVTRVRAEFSGLISYSANWDRYHKVTLWPLVDVLSVSAYFELERSRPGAPEPDIARAWATERERLLQTAARWQRPLLLSEIGYPALPWANAHPWNYVAEDGTRADPEAQARCWRAFFTAWSDVVADADSDALGFCGYRWDPYHRGGARDTGYGVVGKPAYEVIAEGFRGIRDRVGGVAGATTRPGG
ncbi:MAG: hypothetical protein HKN62_19105 [Phycisphaerales bacterium]|nr:hypothetical protein [Phycisphaerales bacterium]